MHRTDPSTARRECSLAKLLFITFIVPVIAALFAAVAFPDRPTEAEAIRVGPALVTLRGESPRPHTGE